jgi:TolA-binding protein
MLNDQQLAQADAMLTDVMANTHSGNLVSYASFWKGEIAYRQQRYDDAIRFTNRFLESGVSAQGEANREAALYNIGYSYLYKEQYKSAQTKFEQIAPSFNSANTSLRQDAYIRLADALYMQRSFTKASAIYQSVVQAGWNSSDYALYQNAMIAGVSSSNDKISKLESLIRSNPNSTLALDANYEIALTHISDEQFRKAIPYLERILTSTDDSYKSKAYLKLGLVYYNTGNNKEALNNYATLIERYPRSAEGEEAMGIVKDIYVEENRLDEYFALMRKAGRSVDASEADKLSYNAAELKYNQNDCAGAIAAFNAYLKQYPEGNYVVDAYYMRSVCYASQEKYPEALQGFDAVVERGVSKYYSKAALEAGQLAYFESKDYAAAKQYFLIVRTQPGTQDNLLIALRGLVRCLYQEKDYDEAHIIAQELLAQKGLATDDKSIANLVLGKSLQQKKQYGEAITAYKSVTTINKSGWGAEARYEIAVCYFEQGDMNNAEKAANTVIKETGSYDYWLTSAYILLGDIFLKQKDYFNAKATYESVAENAVIPDLKTLARDKYEAAVAEEKQHSKIAD